MSGEIDAPRVRLELTSRPEAARLVRSMSTAAGEVLGFEPELLSDVNTAVSEACNNVIQHAYGDQPGPFSVEFALMPDGLEVQIRDYGRGIRESAPDSDGLKVGLALMSAVADRAEFIRGARRRDRGTALLPRRSRRRIARGRPRAVQCKARIGPRCGARAFRPAYRATSS